MQVNEALSNYLTFADEASPGLIEGLYVVGSFALDDWRADRSDIDIIAVTAEPCTDDDFAALRTVHAQLAAVGGPHIDGPYVSWSDLTIAPTTGLHRPWSLDGQLQHDGDCFEINPVTWYTLQRYGVTVRGAFPDQLGIWVDTDERIRFVVTNLQTYWASLADELVAECADDRRAFQPASFEWCALGALRLHYTAFTGDVISKSGAVDYGCSVAPERFHDILRMAGDERSGARPLAAVAVTDMRIAAELIEWVVADVAAAS
jgi:hypothetical protein